MDQLPTPGKILNDDDMVHYDFKVQRKLSREYNEFCKRKGTTRSKRFKAFMIYELKKEAESNAQKQVEQPIEQNSGSTLHE
jgi:hypothetical protein